MRADAVGDVDGSEKEGFYVFDTKVAFVMRVLICPNHSLSRLIQGTNDNKFATESKNK